MNPYRFRPVEEWKTALMNLPSFFDLMRSVFGNIKTPYNKQRLMDDLFTFLSRDDIRKTINAYLDPEDHKIIAAVALLGDPAQEELGEFFQGDRSIPSPRGLILNLEERFILFRFTDEARGKRRYALNPVLEPVLARLAAERGVLFPSEPRETGAQDGNVKTAEFPAFDDRVLGSFFAFVSGEEDFFKTDGIRKKVLDLGKKHFPGLDLDAAAGALRALGLYYIEGEKFFPVNRKIKRFSELSASQRREYWAAGLYLHLMEKASGNSDFVPGLRNMGFRSRAQTMAGLVHTFSGFLDPEKQYPEITFRRFIRLTEPKGLSPWDKAEPLKPDVFISALETAGILKKLESGSRYLVPLNLLEYRGPVIAMDSAFSFILYPGISFKDMLKLASFSSIQEDSPFHFELTRASVVRGFNQGLRSVDMVETLKGLSGNHIDESLEWTIRDWESRYDAVALHEGLILCLSEERQYLAKTEPVASMIRKTLAPGIYLLSSESQEALTALIKAGVDIVAQPRPESVESGLSGGNVFPSPLPVTGNSICGSPSAVTPYDSSQENKKEYFRTYLRNLAISKPETEELLDRIERRIILTESQLEKAAIKYQKLEARGLDYSGKAAIVKQAIADGSELEVTWPGAKGRVITAMGIPQALEKKEGESVLVLKPIDEPGDSEESGAFIVRDTPEHPKTLHDPGTLRIPEMLHIPLGKISLLRMKRQSILND